MNPVILMMKKSPLERLNGPWARVLATLCVQTKLAASLRVGLVLAWSNSGIASVVDNFEIDKPIVFVKVYRELNQLTGEKRGVLKPVVADKQYPQRRGGSLLKRVLQF